VISIADMCERVLGIRVSYVHVAHGLLAVAHIHVAVVVVGVVHRASVNIVLEYKPVVLPR